ncbi:MAG: hypothetical protein H0S82_01340, partial [Anaerolineaceae bacterium]|nr:hypothetical protein [Anaerolineaceae bacterium]
RLAIDDDPERVISFVPDDVLFAERFYGLLDSIKVKEAEYRERAALLSENKTVDEFGIPETAPAGIALLREVCDFMRDEIDTVFGEGTSQKVFGEYRSLSMIEQFFKGITPYIQTARKEKTRQYTDPVIEKRRQIERDKEKAQPVK